MGSEVDGSLANEKARRRSASVGTWRWSWQDGGANTAKSRLSGLLWHGGSAYDAWFSCASNQLFYGLLGSWTAYLISILYLEYRTRKEREKVDFRNHVIQWFEVLDGLLGRHWRNVGLAFNCTFLLFGSVIQLIACASNIYYINDKLDKRTWTYIFGACCATTVFIPVVPQLPDLVIPRPRHDHLHGVVPRRRLPHPWPGRSCTRCGGPQKFKAIYLMATLYVLTLTLPSAASVYWAFGDALLTHSNALALLPRTAWARRGGASASAPPPGSPSSSPSGSSPSSLPSSGPINSAVGSLLVSFTVLHLPALAHMITFRSAHARENAVEPPPRFVGRWTGTFIINAFVVAWVLVVGFGFGGWASMTNFVHQINTFGLFTKCYQCPPPPLPSSPNTTWPPSQRRRSTAPPTAPAPLRPLLLRRAISSATTTGITATGCELLSLNSTSPALDLVLVLASC
ncbi:hypothetical protein GUJ93_ZPchr0013g36742 [Zizania palustris]|uniref:Amino acid transporter transmembrane domain-containing protein n=1 Tax=Zizania palustris TaxID=103762 RepID=A0A8J6C1E2_ZIZPA|nr:hypothetical protein GUJ93_ZPchr0013g36742 [Zizania palustris]